MSWTKTWIKPEVYPLFASMAVALGTCTLFCTRQLFTGPDVFINKKHRKSGYPTEHYDTEAYGKQYKDHAVRRFAHGQSISIFGGLNSTMSGETKTKMSQCSRSTLTACIFFSFSSIQLTID